MTNNSSNRTPLKFGGILFMILLGINLLGELVIGAGVLIDFPLMADMGFNVAYSSDMEVFGIAIGSNLLFATAIIATSMVWTYRSKIEGIITGGIAGGLFVLFALIAFFQMGNTQALLLDGVRGILTVVFAVLAHRELRAASIQR